MMRLFCIILVFKLINGLTLKCEFEEMEFEEHPFYDNNVYTCMVKNFQTTFSNRTVTKVVGTHSSGMTNKNVKHVYFNHQNIPYLPLGLSEFFPNLQTLSIIKSNVQHLLPGDLDGLSDLTKFDVSTNPIEELTKDFFQGHPSIKSISFTDCHLKKIEKGALDGMESLEEIYFDMNPCIDMRIDENFSNYRKRPKEELIADVYDKCTGLSYSLKTPQTCHYENTSGDWAILLIIILLLTMLMNIILGFWLMRVYKNSFGGNWHEMKNVLM